MYTTRKTAIGKLRAYKQELDARYADAVGRRDGRRARAIYDLRRRVLRSILIHEEWAPATPPVWDEAEIRL